MRKLALALSIILLSSCSPDTIRPNCLGKRAYAKVSFAQNPFIKHMDMYGVGHNVGAVPAEPKKIGKAKTLTAIEYKQKVLKHTYTVQLNFTQDRGMGKNEYVVNIFIDPKEYYKCSVPVAFIESDLNQIIAKIPLRKGFKEQLYDAIDVQTLESKKLDIY